MTIEQTKVVDFVALDEDHEDAFLIIDAAQERIAANGIQLKFELLDAETR